jgi:hypothetical protein
MSNILKIIDLTDHAIRRVLLAVLDGVAAEQRPKCQPSAAGNRTSGAPMTTQTDYSRLLQERHARSTVMFADGYPIRRIRTGFGDVYAVVGTDSAFATLAQAEAHARQLAEGRADR